MRQETPADARKPRPRFALRSLAALSAVLIVSAAAAAVHRRIEDGRHGWTSRAQWIWAARAGRLPKPLRFYAARELRLDRVPPRFEARLLVDPEYRLLVNGREIAGGRCRPGDALVAADLAPALHPGVNWIAVETGSADGMGGILFDAEGAGTAAAALASSAGWRVAPDLESIERGGGTPAIVWGAPPQAPWGYPAAPGGNPKAPAPGS